MKNPSNQPTQKQALEALSDALAKLNFFSSLIGLGAIQPDGSWRFSPEAMAKLMLLFGDLAQDAREKTMMVFNRLNE